MKQKFTVLFDLDGTLVDTAPDLMLAHNHVMKKFGYPTKSTEDIRNLVGKGAGALIGRSIWGQAKKEFSKVLDEKIKDEMVKEFVNFYGKNIVNESTLINGVKEFLKWCKEQNISMAVCTNKQERLSNDLLKKRKMNQPVWLPNAGCIFKNPDTKNPAGKLIELSGLKGKKAGNAQISDRHANFIVNNGGATAGEIISLINSAQKEVYINFQIRLETEVQIVG